MDIADENEHEVLNAVFSFLDEWDERPDATSKTTRNNVQQPETQPWLEPFVDGKTNQRKTRELPKQELMRLREEIPELEKQLKSLRSKRTRYEAANCEASRVIALAARELKRGQSETANTQLLLVWKEMAKKHERLRKQSEEENRILRKHVIYQSRTIESLQKLKSAIRPSSTSLSLIFPRTNTFSSDEARNTLKYLSTLLHNQLLETNKVFNLKTMSPTLSEVRVEMISSTRMHLEFLYSKHLPFDYRSAAKALWKMCQHCQGSTGVGPTMRQDISTTSFTTTYKSDELSFVMNGHCTTSIHDDLQRSIIVASSKFDLFMLKSKNNPGASYNEKSWIVFEPVQGGVTELCMFRVCARIDLNVEGSFPSKRERYMELLSEMLQVQKRQELETVRLGIENELLGGS